MMDQNSLLAYTASVFSEIGIKYCVVGSMASILFGEIRSTQDIDIIADMKATHIRPFLAKYPSPEYLIDEEQIREAVLTRFQFNVIHTTTANKLDIIMPGAGSWKSGQIQRARMMHIADVGDVSVAAPEDVILGKLWYHSVGGGERHLRDITAMLNISGSLINREDITRWATELGYLELWNKVIEKADAPEQPPGPGVP
jgi:hypothetical protein